MRAARRRLWRNHTGNQSVYPLRIYEPESIEEIAEVVREAERLGCTARAVGSRHAWSDVALTTGLVIEPRRLRRPLELERGLLRDGVDTTALVRAEAGMPLRELNAHLDTRELGLSNMGGYDAQTIAGVIATSTHGSGIGFGPICDSVRSMDLVAGGGRVHRIEPAVGLTDPGAYAARHPDRVLHQDDDFFHAALVGMGCMGVIHSVMLEVEPRYWLKEVRTLSTWSAVKRDLEAGQVLRENRHYEVYLSPYPRDDGELPCLVTTRNRAAGPVRGRGGKRSRRNLATEIGALLPFTPTVLNLLVDLWPRLTPRLLETALEGLSDDEYTNVSYRVLNIGTANLMPAYSSEIAVPLDGRHLEAVERIVAVARRRREAGAVYHTSPIALRFVKASPAFMSMMHGRDTMMIELIQMTRTEGGMELLAAYEDALYGLGGRPHWGQVNSLTGSADLLRSMYPRYDDWLEVHGQLNASGVFDSPFAKRVGISTRSFAP